ncbi:MAG: accessory gene regulator B family protein [Clostridiaceae bacterium]|nr:accessory gene regulator B family protein [Clostridiaceae bacterium]
MFDKISNYMTDMIYSTLPDIAPERREVIEYGVYMTVSELAKIAVILLISILLGIVPYVLAVVAVYGIQRTFLGGIHAKTHLGCMLTHSVIVFGVTAAAIYLKVEISYLILPVMPFAYVSAYLYAPADLPQKPVKSKRQRKQLRIGGFILLTVLFTASMLLPETWSRIILFTCFIQALFMTPIAYKISKNKYGREEALV